MSSLTAPGAGSIAGDPTASVGRARPEAGDVYFHLLAALSGGGDADKVASIVRANTPGDELDVHAPLAMVGADGYFAGWSTTVGLFTFVKAVEIDNQAIVQLLLDCNVDIDTVDQGGRNALHLAAAGHSTQY